MMRVENEALSLAKAALRKYNADEIDWEQRRYEIAKAALSNPAFVHTETIGQFEAFHIDRTVRNALKIADELIKELKGGKPCE